MSLYVFSCICSKLAYIVFLLLGRIPMRHLVYRVQALPQSMLPLVWDFGQLSTDVEKLYIRQMVLRYVRVITLLFVQLYCSK